MGYSLPEPPRLAVILGGILLLGLLGRSYREIKNFISSLGNTAESRVIIAVHIEGTVALPGLYYIDEGTRLGELLEMAGGVTGEADTGKINYARILSNGEKIIIPEGKNLIGKLGIGRAPEESFLPPVSKGK